MSTPRLKVGDTLWWVPNHGEPGEVVVKKVGRRWATVGVEEYLWTDMRVDLETLVADGENYSSPGSCWRTKEEYDLYLEATKLWYEIQQFCYKTRSMPAHLDVDDLGSILQTLKGNP